MVADLTAAVLVNFFYLFIFETLSQVAMSARI